MIAIGDLGNQVQTDMQQVLAQAEQYADDAIDAKLGPVLLTLAALATQIRNITSWIDDCGEPMCDTMGPKTGLGKWLKALEGLLGLLAGFTLAELTEHQLEHYATVFASISGQESVRKWRRQNPSVLVRRRSLWANGRVAPASLPA